MSLKRPVTSLSNLHLSIFEATLASQMPAMAAMSKPKPSSTPPVCRPPPERTNVSWCDEAADEIWCPVVRAQVRAAVSAFDRCSTDRLRAERARVNG